MTLTIGVIGRNVPGPGQRKRLPAYPLPVLRVARLGVDLRARGLGIGEALLRSALRLATAQRDSVGCLGVVVDAKPDAIEFYRKYGFVPLEDVRERMLGGDPTPMLLPMSSIVESLGAE